MSPSPTDYAFVRVEASASRAERGHDVGVAFHEAVVPVDPTAAGFLALREGRHELGSPVVFHALGVDHRRLAEQGHRFGERLVVVIQASLTLPGVLVERVILADVLQARP